MQGMMDLGTFGDERLKKRGPISWPRSRPSARPAYVGSAAIGRRRKLSTFSAQRGGNARDHALTTADHTATAARGRHVLAIQDTTELNFSGHAKSKRGFGVVGNGRDIGLFLHPVIVVDAGDAIRARWAMRAHSRLGRQHLQRKKAPPGGRKKREAQRKRPRPIALKESGRWIGVCSQADRVLSEAAMVTVIDDREGDIYEKFATPPCAHVHLLGRADHNRVMSDGAKLFATMASLAQCRRAANPYSAKGGKPARTAQTRVSWKEVEFVRPRSGHDVKRLPPRVKLRAVRVEEVDPPKGVKPVLWLLLTTHSVESLEDALQIVSWYRARWTIDIDQTWRLSRIKGWRVWVALGSRRGGMAGCRAGGFEFGDCRRVRGDEFV